MHSSTAHSGSDPWVGSWHGKQCKCAGGTFDLRWHLGAGAACIQPSCLPGEHAQAAERGRPTFTEGQGEVCRAMSCCENRATSTCWPSTAL